MNNNSLSIIENFSVDGFSDSDLALLQQKITDHRLNLLVSAFEGLKKKQDEMETKMHIIQEENKNNIENIRDESNKKLEVTINKMRVDKNKWGFGSQAEFGARFRVSIGAKTVGLLFKTIGLAKKSKSATEPMRSTISSGKATTEIVNGYETFRWHHEKCLKHLDKWLDDHDLLEKFYSIEKEKELQKYIQNLYNTYCYEDYWN